MMFAADPIRKTAEMALSSVDRMSLLTFEWVMEVVD